ncbi:hypothetical protein [Nannocystis pusilla]|uniref:hypothetical protein n=1 Tax=Nannocystis pusilla TaxID=889268 RepID=UPI003BF2C5C8
MLGRLTYLVSHGLPLDYYRNEAREVKPPGGLPLALVCWHSLVARPSLQLSDHEEPCLPRAHLQRLGVGVGQRDHVVGALEAEEPARAQAEE